MTSRLPFPVRLAIGAGIGVAIGVALMWVVVEVGNAIVARWP